MAGLTGVAATRPDLPLPPSPKVETKAGQVAQDLPGGMKLRVFQPTGRVYAEVLDPKNGEVIKTIPPMDLLKVMSKVDHAIGLLLDRKG